MDDGWWWMDGWVCYEYRRRVITRSGECKEVNAYELCVEYRV